GRERGAPRGAGGGVVRGEGGAARQIVVGMGRDADGEAGGLALLKDVAEVLRADGDARFRVRPARHAREQDREDDGAYGGRRASTLAPSHDPERRRGRGGVLRAGPNARLRRRGGSAGGGLGR